MTRFFIHGVISLAVSTLLTGSWIVFLRLHHYREDEITYRIGRIEPSWWGLAHALLTSLILIFLEVFGN
jgi:hypothetical protein